MTLLNRVSVILARHGIDHALIGAAALAAHGIARATLDLDLLATDPACLDDGIWEGLRATGTTVEIRRGDVSDPLGGVVRIESKEEAPVDLIVGRSAWQLELIRRATPLPIGGSPVPVVRARAPGSRRSPPYRGGWRAPDQPDRGAKTRKLWRSMKSWSATSA